MIAEKIDDFKNEEEKPKSWFDKIVNFFKEQEKEKEVDSTNQF